MSEARNGPNCSSDVTTASRRSWRYFRTMRSTKRSASKVKSRALSGKLKRSNPSKRKSKRSRYAGSWAAARSHSSGNSTRMRRLIAPLYGRESRLFVTLAQRICPYVTGPIHGISALGFAHRRRHPPGAGDRLERAIHGVVLVDRGDVDRLGLRDHAVAGVE